MKIKKIQFFNMIEVILALTVVAVGMTSIMGLFPVGLNASRNAIAQNMSADVADQMITYLRVMGESSQTAYDETFDLDADMTTDLPIYDNLDIKNSTNFENNITIDIQGSGGNDVEVQTLSDNFLADYKDNEVQYNNTNDTNGNGMIFQRVANDWAIFTLQPVSGTHRRRVYFVVQGPSCTKDGGNRNIDFSAMVLVWKSPAQIKRWDGLTWSLWPEDSVIYSDSPTNSTIDETQAFDASAKINIELSWPLELPYNERKKRYYQVVITKPSL